MNFSGITPILRCAFTCRRLRRAHDLHRKLSGMVILDKCIVWEGHEYELNAIISTIAARGGVLYYTTSCTGEEDPRSSDSLWILLIQSVGYSGF